MENSIKNPMKRPMVNKYMAKLYCSNSLLKSETGTDKTKLLVFLLNQIQQTNGVTYGMILNKSTGKVIHRCRKSTDHLGFQTYAS